MRLQYLDIATTNFISCHKHFGSAGVPTFFCCYAMSNDFAFVFSRVRLHPLFSYQAKLKELDLVLWLDENAHAMEWGFSFLKAKAWLCARVSPKKSIQNHIYFIIYQYVKLYHGRYSRFVQNRLSVSVLIQSIQMIYKMLNAILYRF